MAKRRIAILGGGVGSITAAWALTSLPGWSDRFEITLYQMGWRLGGKGASGRNARYGQRIEEHGLHIWMGFYDNAFRALQQCYDELNRPASCPIRTWTDAFHPHNDIVLYEFVKGRWRDWPITVPMRAGAPGADREPHEVTKLFEELLEWLAGVICGPAHEPALVAMFDAWRTAGRPGWLAGEWEHVRAFVAARLSRMAQFTGAGHKTDHLAWLMEDLHAARRAASDALRTPMPTSRNSRTPRTLPRSIPRAGKGHRGSPRRHPPSLRAGGAGCRRRARHHPGRRAAEGL